MHFFFSSRNNKQFEMTGAEHADNLGLLSQMRRMKYSCVSRGPVRWCDVFFLQLAMWYMTKEVFYKEALVIVQKAIKKLKKILKRGQCHYNKVQPQSEWVPFHFSQFQGGKLHSAIMDFEDFLPAYMMTKLQIELKMHPSNTDDVIRKMLDLTIAQQPVNMKFVTVRKY